MRPRAHFDARPSFHSVRMTALTSSSGPSTTLWALSEIAVAMREKVEDIFPVNASWNTWASRPYARSLVGGRSLLWACTVLVSAAEAHAEVVGRAADGADGAVTRV